MLICIFQTVNAQDTIIKHYDSNWNEISKKKASYYRKIFENEKKIWSVRDYYINGQIQMAGTYKSKDLKKKNGFFKLYYKNGNKQQEGEYINNQYNGVWKWYYKNGKISSKERYRKDKLEEIEFWDANGNKQEGKLEKTIMPQFIGGNLALHKFISSNIRYPIEAQKKGLEGKILVKFIVGLNGEIEKAWISQSGHISLKIEALRLVNSMPNWIPGKNHNLPTKVSYTIPINFNLR